MNIAGILGSHDLFKALSMDEINHLVETASVKSYKATETIFKFEQTGAHLFLLVEGSVSLRLPSPVGEPTLVISKVGKGEVFGLSPLLGSTQYTAEGYCESDAEVVAMEARPFNSFLLQNSRTGVLFMSEVANIYFTRYIEVLKNLQGIVHQIPLLAQAR